MDDFSFLLLMLRIAIDEKNKKFLYLKIKCGIMRVTIKKGEKGHDEI